MNDSDLPPNVVPFQKTNQKQQNIQDQAKTHITAEDLKITDSPDSRPNLGYEFAKIWKNIMIITNHIGYCDDPSYIQEVSERLDVLAQSVYENSKL